MVLDEQKLETLIKRLDEQRQAYLESQDLLHQLLEEAREPPQSPLPVVPQSPQTSLTSRTVSPSHPDPMRRRKISTGLDSVITSSASRATGEDSDEEETAEEFFAQTPLEHQAYTEEGLQEHLASYKWPEEGQRILADVLDAPKRLLSINLFPKIKGPVPDRSHLSHHQVFDVGTDGAPLALERQLADRQQERAEHHIAITRCSSVVALHLGGKPIKRIKNRSRRGTGITGEVFDPFAAWQVLNIQCYPDWQCSLDVHDSTKHYVNGVEAFMVTILGEFKDAQKRFEAIYHKITRLITPPLDFMFNDEVREKLLFEDAEFTFTRRYFWAAQTLGIVNESIKAMIDAYEDNFTEEVWLGTHKTLWLLEEHESPRNLYFRKKMSTLRAKFEAQMKSLGKLILEIDARRNEIRTLREELFVGTSIQESRKSVENSDITVLQGHNIKILTMVSIFFLPLTFVTSVFGMTNMPTDEQYWNFGIVTVCVCVPFFVLIGSLNSNRGMHFWSNRTRVVLRGIANFLAWLSGHGDGQRKGEAVSDAPNESRNRMAPRRPSARSATSMEARRGMRMRTASTSSDVPSTSEMISRVPVNRPGIPARQAGGSAAALPPRGLARMILQESRQTQRINYNLEHTHNIV
ncbi:hypothetical protein E8E14_001880 [Neopestalotiopsis sp. 37M]|nr:hypothetical protein E8E14_001880 [Neopestalotiopsis sp. 37M]